MLMGIVTKNAIMLVDFAVEAMHGGADRTTAIIEAGQKRARHDDDDRDGGRHGPSALAFGAGGEFRSPMAIAIIGGLLVSTFPVTVLGAGVLHHHGRRGPSVLEGLRMDPVGT